MNSLLGLIASNTEFMMTDDTTTEMHESHASTTPRKSRAAQLIEAAGGYEPIDIKLKQLRDKPTTRIGAVEDKLALLDTVPDLLKKLEQRAITAEALAVEVTEKASERKNNLMKKHTENARKKREENGLKRIAPIIDFVRSYCDEHPEVWEMAENDACDAIVDVINQMNEPDSLRLKTSARPKRDVQKALQVLVSSGQFTAVFKS